MSFSLRICQVVTSRADSVLQLCAAAGCCEYVHYFRSSLKSKFKRFDACRLVRIGSRSERHDARSSTFAILEVMYREFDRRS